MGKNTYIKEKMNKGEMAIYDFGEIKLHAYKTNDFMDDEVFIVEKEGQAVILEAPCFFDNIRELAAYLQDKKLKAAGLLLAYHMAGASFLPGVPVYSTANANEYGHTGGGAALIAQFADTFGEGFDRSVFTVTDYIDPGRINIGGIDFVITQTQEAFDIVIPAINAVYTHMLGHDCHSIVAGAGHADAMVAQLNGYIQAGYGLVLTSHYTPEDLKDVEAKTAYLERLKQIAGECADSAAFKTRMQAEYPHYSGENYLDMTAGIFFS